MILDETHERLVVIDWEYCTIDNDEWQATFRKRRRAGRTRSIHFWISRLDPRRSQTIDV